MPVKKMKGKWYIDARVLIPGKGRTRLRRISPLQTRKGAVAFERQCVENALSMSKGSAAKARLTLHDFAVKQYLTVYAPANNRFSQVETAEAILRVHLLPALGHLALDAIDGETIDKYKATKLSPAKGKALAIATVTNHLAILHKIFSLAVEWGYLERAPKIRKPKAGVQTFDFLTVDESERLLAAASPEWKPILLVALRTGMRHGELLGLHWKDVDLAGKKIVVRRSVVRNRLGPTKSGRQREIALSPSALETLQALAKGKKGAHVFVDANHQPLMRSRCRRPLNWMCRAAGLREIGWHVLRHTFASHLAQAGATLQTIQQLLGHSTVTVTLRYAHLSPKFLESAIHLLEAPKTPAGTPS